MLLKIKNSYILFIGLEINAQSGLSVTRLSGPFNNMPEKNSGGPSELLLTCSNSCLFLKSADRACHTSQRHTPPPCLCSTDPALRRMCHVTALASTGPPLLPPPPGWLFCTARPSMSLRARQQHFPYWAGSLPERSYSCNRGGGGVLTTC